MLEVHNILGLTSCVQRKGVAVGALSHLKVLLNDLMINAHTRTLYMYEIYAYASTK